MSFPATTGTCAAAATAAAAEHWLGKPCREVEVTLPDLTRVRLDVEETSRDRQGATSTVRKPPNDDPDATRNLSIQVRIVPGACQGIRFLAGKGVGTVTKPGLRIPPGEAAINPVPRERMGRELASRGIADCLVVVSAPGGREAAWNTFNHRLGVEGGISILGTTGRVRPFSREAVVETIRLQLAMARASGAQTICLVPGHIGAKAALASGRFEPEGVVEVSNHWGEAVDHAADLGFTTLHLAGHPGKLGKLAHGQWNTHSQAGSHTAAWVADLALALEFAVDPSPSTVEAIFSSLPQQHRRVLGDALAQRVARAVNQRGGLACEVVLTGYEGENLGRGETA